MTPKQRDLARHALGLPNPTNVSYRNRFLVRCGDRDHEVWMEMVKRGEAGVRFIDGSETGDFFWLTTTGARLALKRKEKLDMEDFHDA